MSHTRRQFIRRCAGAAGAAAMSRSLGAPRMTAQSQQSLTNWAGNLTYGSPLSTVTSVPQVRDFVRSHDRLRVLGTRHCFNSIADSTAHLLSVRDMNRVVSIDAATRTVTLEAGMSYGQLCPGLDEKGFALHNLASLPHISVAGACATGTHGSGVKNGNLSTAVSAMELVTPDGDVVSLSRDKDGGSFLGSVVHLGALGVVTKVTLDILPTFTLSQEVYENLPMAQLAGNFDAIMSASYSVSLFTDWQKGRISELWVKRRVEE